MFTRYIALVVCIFFISSCLAQKKIQGRIIDANSLEPVSYAAISILGEDRGVSSSLDGEFKLQLFDEDIKKEIVISAIGYQNSTLKLSKLKTTKNLVKLSPVTYEIKETVILGKKKRKKIIVVDKLRASIFNQTWIGGPSAPQILAKKFKNENKLKGLYLDEIGIFFNREKDFDMNPLFVLRVFEVDTLNNMPGKDLLAKTVVKLDKCKAQSHYKHIIPLKNQIIFPENGVYVGIEWIATKENQSKLKKNYFSPWLSGKFRKKIENNLWEFSGGKWFLHDKNEEPYIQIQLKNFKTKSE